jgi:O-antigen/teichoic acid export membrane protein
MFDPACNMWLTRPYSPSGTCPAATLGPPTDDTICSMTPVKRNIVWSFGGSIWASLLGLLFVPVYIRFLTVEAYGLIGVFAIIQAFSAILDSGLSTTLNKELAYASGNARDPGDVRDLAASITTVFWIIGALIAAASIAAAPLIVRHWVEAESLNPAVIHASLVLMGVNFALQWPAALYTGGMQGLQRHVLLNIVLIVAAAVRSIGAIAVLALVSPTLTAFFTWQIITSGATTATLHVLLWRSLPTSPRRARFSLDELRKVGRFAAGMSGLTVLVLALTQADKLILSRMLSMEAFGYYIVAGMVAAVISRLIMPLYGALFPRFSELVGSGGQAELARVYHRGCQLAAVLLLPVSLVLIAFSWQILWVWTGDVEIAGNTYLLLSLLAAGAAINGVMVLPYAIQIAHSWTRLSVASNVVAVVAIVPMIIFATTRWGAAGAAGVWALLNTGYLVLQPWFIHRRILRGEMRSWYVNDVLTPFAAALASVVVWRFLLPADASVPLIIAWVGGALITTAGAAVASVDWLRKTIIGLGAVSLRQLSPAALLRRI